jgi:hypothetical protein
VSTRRAGAQTQIRYADPDDPIAAMLVVNDEHGNRADLLVGLRGLEAEAFARAVEVPFQGQLLKIIGCEDCIAMKVFAGGPQAITDARSVLQAAGDSVDLPLLRRLAARYGRQARESLESILTAPDS